MDLPKRVAPHGSPGRNPNPREMATATAPRAVEADENATPRRPAPPARSASPQRKKVLGERNSGDSRGDGSSAQPKPAPSPTPTPASPTSRAGPYDPKTNCTTPRPEFLRYDPKRSAEILLRLEREAAEDEELSGVTSGTEISEPASSGSYSGDSERDDADEEEEEEVPARGGGWARRLFLLLVSAACLLCYVYCMSSSTPFPATTSEKYPLDFVGWNGSMRDVGGHEVFSLLGPVDMMGLGDGPEAIVYSDSEDGIPLRGPGGSPSNFMAVAMMGMADACPNVPLGEFSCQIEGESSENVDVLKEDSHIGDLKSEAVAGRNVLENSFGSTHNHDTGSTEEGLVHREKGEDDSDHSMEKTMESESAKVEHDDEELHSLEYGNTAEAAKELAHMVKKLWSAVEPHLLKMLACLSVAAAFVTAMLLKYSRRSRKANVRVSKRTHSAPPARVPVLAPHNIAQPPVFRSEQPVQRPMPKPEPSSCLQLPVQSVLPRPDPPASLDVPSVGHGNRDQMIQQGDGGIVRASDDKSMPPVVQLLGEFSFVDTGSSRGRPVKDPNQHGGDIRVQESTPPRKDVVRMQKESDKARSPGIQAAMKKESPAEEMIDPTPTPLRRSSRLRKKPSP